MPNKIWSTSEWATWKQEMDNERATERAGQLAEGKVIKARYAKRKAKRHARQGKTAAKP